MRTTDPFTWELLCWKSML